MKRLLIMLPVIMLVAGCNGGLYGAKVAPFNSSSNQQCVMVTYDYAENQSLNGLYCKADVTLK